MLSGCLLTRPSVLTACHLQIMVPYNYTEFIDGLTFQAKNKIIPMSRIDDAVRRILRVKFIMGLFENPLADLSLVNQLGSQVKYLTVDTTTLQEMGSILKLIE